MLLIIFFKILFLIIPLLISVAYFTIAERKIMGAIQMRRGPNVTGYIGLLQPLADGAKLFAKETIIPNNSNEQLFLTAPFMALSLSIISWAVIPFGEGLFLCDLNLGIIYIFAISALNVYSLLFAGWSSNSKYAYLGSIRSAAQMISYEISIGFSCLIVIISVGSYNLSKIVLFQTNIWFMIPFFPIFIIFYISILAETNRHPFDLPEAESELVSGYNVEYSAMPFAQFFLGEYANMLLMSVFGSILFLGGWLLNLLFFLPEPVNLSLKICFGVLYFIFNRAIFPRFRYDQLMNLGWKTLLPLVIGYFIFTAGLLISFNILPN
jgi:NADH-quinone oxidoreductase subunit H|uniref:NADH-ubiquinone oxidoreductase chain 1 n=1 Tax=Entomoneis sp. TaxID=186043 RepID=A0A3G1PWC0_9STRA|nr:NADH dehydrogenase subunit 1 [Entomoneis sp.]